MKELRLKTANFHPRNKLMQILVGKGGDPPRKWPPRLRTPQPSRKFHRCARPPLHRPTARGWPAAPSYTAPRLSKAISCFTTLPSLLDSFTRPRAGRSTVSGVADLWDLLDPTYLAMAPPRRSCSRRLQVSVGKPGLIPASGRARPTL